jgi:cytochrome c oxidase assembly protein subunit 15
MLYGWHARCVMRAAQDRPLDADGAGFAALHGLATIYLNWPLAIAVLHNGGAALLVILMVMLNYKVRYAPSGLAAAAPPASARPVTP